MFHCKCSLHLVYLHKSITLNLLRGENVITMAILSPGIPSDNWNEVGERV
jgi:hypothetical protein